MIHDTTVTNNRAGQRKPRPSLAREARDLYRLAAALGDSETMAIAMKDMEIAFELERADEIVQPLPDNRHGFRGCRHTSEELRTMAGRPVNAGFHVTPRPEPEPSAHERVNVIAPGTISTTEYARRNGIHYTTASALARRGKIPAQRVTLGTWTVWRIRDEEVA